MRESSEIALSGANNATMTSQQIAEMVGSRHDKVKLSIERLAERQIIDLPELIRSKNHLGQMVSEYLFCGRKGELDSYVVIARISPQHIGSIVSTWGKSKDSLSKLIEAMNQFDVPSELSHMYIYAIIEKNTGNIKIGISADPEKRLSQLQTANSSELILAATVKASDRFKSERDAHQINSSSHIRGEWFNSEAIQYFCTGEEK